MLGREYWETSDGRPRKHKLTDEEFNNVMLYRRKEPIKLKVENKSGSDTKDYQKTNGQVVMSSWDHEKGRNMTIEEYCEKYNLPYDYISSWKAVTHTGTPYYNTVFKTVSQALREQLTEEDMKEIISSLVKPVLLSEADLPKPSGFKSSNIDRLIYSDVHIGMDPNGEKGNALYGRTWNEQDMMSTCEEIVAQVIKRQTGSTLIIDELGDFMDGWDGHTVRKGHDLPQCMSNDEAFNVGLRFKIRMVQMLSPFYDRIICNNVCEDNHAGTFGKIVNDAFKLFIETQFPDKVNVFNRTQFMSHYHIAEHLFVLCHGKDSQHLKFGFKPFLDQKQAEKIDQYLKHHGLYKLGCRIEFSKGDSHQALFDMCTSDDFEYMNYPSLAPSSDWVQVNFKKGRRGFVVQHFESKGQEKFIDTFFLK